MIKVKQFYNPTEKEMNDFFESTKGTFISFNQSMVNKEFVTPDQKTVSDPVMIVNIVYNTNINTGGGMN